MDGRSDLKVNVQNFLCQPFCLFICLIVCILSRLREKKYLF